MTDPKPPLPADWQAPWPRIDVDPADPDVALILKLATSAADRWALGPTGPYAGPGATLMEITGNACREGLLHLLELGLIDIDTSRLRAAPAYPIQREETPDA